ncbi:MAG: T9SS type A sorting domain-containing protein [Candidatus Eisenbacteria bacterium]|nr:T9SS type A sorting domain-containing protein [Candidatus Eisenbacteria bacterium]
MKPDRIAALVALGLAAFGSPALADEFAIPWWTLDGGGTVETLAGGGFAVSGTIGQHDAGQPMMGGTYQIQGGFWTGALRIASDVAEQDVEGSAGGTGGLVFGLDGSAPNPFRTRSIVSFELPSRQPVNLAIFDLSGRLCRTLINEDVEAGRHERMWDARDNEGREVASGIYFAVLSSPLGQQRQKLVKIH